MEAIGRDRVKTVLGLSAITSRVDSSQGFHCVLLKELSARVEELLYTSARFCQQALYETPAELNCEGSTCVWRTSVSFSIMAR